MTNAIKAGKKECIVRPTSKLLNKLLELFKREGFIGELQLIDNNKGGEIKILFNGNLNKCFAIKPRFSANKEEIEKFEKRYLPAQDFGCLIISTTQGLLTNHEIKEKSIGGKLIAYVY
jgi:small subunit ribosomal protein S8